MLHGNFSPSLEDIAQEFPCPQGIENNKCKSTFVRELPRGCGGLLPYPLEVSSHNWGGMDDIP